MKIMKEWHKPGKDSYTYAYPVDWYMLVNDLYYDYEMQVVLSYLSFLYSTSKYFTGIIGIQGASQRMLYPRNGKFVYALPILVKITDIESQKWTFGMIEPEFEQFSKHGLGPVPLINQKRALDFGLWVSGTTMSDYFHASEISISDSQGYWFHPPSLFMTDGQITLVDIHHTRGYEARVEEIHKILKILSEEVCKKTASMMSRVQSLCGLQMP